MAEVSSAASAAYLRTGHAQAAVVVRVHCRVGNWPEETWPAGSRIELRLRFKERRAATRAQVGTRSPGIPVLPGEGSFGSVPAQRTVLFPTQGLLPFSVGPGISVFHGEAKIQTWRPLRHPGTHRRLTDPVDGNTVFP